MDFEISETLIIAVTAENIIYSISSPKVISGVKNDSVNISCTHSLWAPHPDQVRNLSLLIQCRRILARPVFPPTHLLHWAIEGLPTGDLAGHRKKLLINHLLLHRLPSSFIVFILSGVFGHFFSSPSAATFNTFLTPCNFF